MYYKQTSLVLSNSQGHNIPPTQSPTIQSHSPFEHMPHVPEFTLPEFYTQAEVLFGRICDQFSKHKVMFISWVEQGQSYTFRETFKIINVMSLTVLGLHFTNVFLIHLQTWASLHKVIILLSLSQTEVCIKLREL